MPQAERQGGLHADLGETGNYEFNRFPFPTPVGSAIIHTILRTFFSPEIEHIVASPFVMI